MKRALGLLALAVLQLAAVPVRHRAPSGDVLGISVVPAPGRAEVVIDVRGPVEVTDFVLRNPARLVLDLTGARLVAPALAYDGVNRAGIRGLRYSQFRPDVVRIVIDLEEVRDYRMVQGDNAVRVTFDATQSFAAWPDGAPAAASRAADLPAAIPAAIPAAPTAPPARRSAAVPADAAPAVSQQRQRISVRWDQASIVDVIASFAAYSGRSIISGRGVVATTTITAEINDQPWDVAFNEVLASQGLAASEMPSGIIRVDTPANLNPPSDTTEPLVTRRVKINYARAAALVPSVVAVVSAPPRGKVASDTTTNSIIVTDLRSRMPAVEDFVRSLDERTEQVAIQAKIIFVQRTDLEGLGFRYDLGTGNQFSNAVVQRPDPVDTSGATPYDPKKRPWVIDLGGNAVAAVANANGNVADAALQIVYSSVIGNFTLSTFLEALQSVSLADVQAEPQVTVVDNQLATIWVGEKTPYRTIDASAQGGASGPAIATTKFEETGIRLRVTPHVVRGTREVMMEIHAERSGVRIDQVIGQIFEHQEATTQVLVRDGETAVIGGLTVTEVTVGKTGIPFLVDLPVIGRLFGYRTSKENRRDLLILVTPHIVDDLNANEPQRP
jgi:type IV pilus assembly protein PilQ